MNTHIQFSTSKECVGVVCCLILGRKFVYINKLQAVALMCIAQTKRACFYIIKNCSELADVGHPVVLFALLDDLEARISERLLYPVFLGIDDTGTDE